ncbi:hypothetical protein [Bdellovibrio sp. HCB209]|uniref:hypothetical protein n=1 Tax=Bdellovibrio sp. HCB209 TaxID=3394354 RepID=UPI0039B58ACF
MKMFALFIMTILYSLLSWGEVCSSGTAFDNLNALAKNSCEQTVKSKECTDLYAQMKANGENPADKAPNCSGKDLLSQEYSAWSYSSGCSIGGWNFVKDTFVGVGTAIADSAKSVGKFVDDIELENAANKACDADPNGKAQLIEQYNQNVPKLLKIAEPADSVLAKTTCAKVKATIKLQQGQKADELSLTLNRKMLLQKSNLTADEKELVEWGQRRLPGTQMSLLDAAKAKIKEAGIRLECYNSQQAAAMVCEALAEVSIVAAGPTGLAMKAARMKNIAKLAGVSIDARKATSTTRMVATAADLEKAAKLSNVERIATAEQSLGRALTAAEKKALVDAHEVAAGTGRGYGTYSATDLKNKADILKTAGFSEAERETLLRQGLAGSLSSSTYARTYTNTMRLQAEKLLGSGKTAEAKQSFRSAADSFEVVAKDAKYTKSDRDYWMGSKINANAERYDKAAEYFIKSYSKETGNSRAEAIYDALNREKQQLRTISSQNAGSTAAQANYQTHRKLIEAVVSNPQLQLSDALKAELLRP